MIKLDHCALLPWFTWREADRIVVREKWIANLDVTGVEQKRGHTGIMKKPDTQLMKEFVPGVREEPDRPAIECWEGIPRDQIAKWVRKGSANSRFQLSDPRSVIGCKDLPVAPVALVEVEVLISWIRAS